MSNPDTPKFDLGQMVRLSPAMQREYRDIGNLPGKVDRIDANRRELTVWWGDRGTRINLTFDDVEAVNG